MFPYGIQFALCRVLSPVLTASLLISFPVGTKMLQFPTFPILTDRLYRDSREVPLGHPGIKGSMRLPQAFRCLARPSSAPEPNHPPDGLLAAGFDSTSVQVAYEYVIIGFKENSSGFNEPIHLPQEEHHFFSMGAHYCDIPITQKSYCFVDI